MDTPQSEMWEFEGKQFKRCPKCNKGILAEWTSHNCGWGKTQSTLPAIVSQNNRDESDKKIAASVAWKSAGDIIAATTKKGANLDMALEIQVKMATRGVRFILTGE